MKPWWVLVCATTWLGCQATSGARTGGPDGGAAMDASAPVLGCSSSPDAHAPDGGVCIGDVKGQVVDETAGPLPQTAVTFCGEVCTIGKSASDGSFDIVVNRSIVLAHYALSVLGRPTRVNYFVELPSPIGLSIALTTPLVVPLLPTTGPLIALDQSAQSLTSGDVTLTLEAGTDVQLDPADSETPSGRQFRALSVVDPSRLPFTSGLGPVDALYGFAPFEAVFSKKTRLAFANSARLAAGSAVDVLVVRGRLNGSPPPASAFDVVASAHVTQDGATIAIDPGNGVTTLTWIALRKAK